MLNVRIITIMPKKLTTEEWINKARIKHGDKYDYSKSVYTGWDTRIVITCPKHGDFEVLPNHFLRYKGCPKCSAESHAKYMQKSLDDFLKDALNMVNFGRLQIAIYKVVAAQVQRAKKRYVTFC